MSKAKKLSKPLIAVIAFIVFVVGLGVGAFGRLFVTTPDSYVLPPVVSGGNQSHSSTNSATSAPASSVGKLATSVVEAEDMSIHFLELGNKYAGDCVFINIGTIEILIDAGSRNTSASVIEQYIDPYIDGELDYVIVTHAHQDHYAGFATNNGLFTYYSQEHTITTDSETKTIKGIGNIIQFAYTTKGECRSTEAEILAGSNSMYKTYLIERNKAKNKEGNATPVIYGDEYNYGNTDAEHSPVIDLTANIQLQILYNYYYFNKASTENDHSLCCMISQKMNNGKVKKYLFTGDMEEKGEKKMIDFYATNSSAYSSAYSTLTPYDTHNIVSTNPTSLLSDVEVYKGAHHGSKTSSTTEFMKIVSPTIVCICTCAGSSEYTKVDNNQFPTQQFVDRVFPYTTNVYVTTLCIDYDAGTYQSMNGDIVVMSSVGDDENENTKLNFSYNDILLKDTEWFIAHRKYLTNN